MSDSSRLAQKVASQGLPIGSNWNSRSLLLMYKGYAGCWLKKEKRALPVSPGSLAEAGGNLISEDSHMLRLLFGFCGWFGVLLSPASTAPNCQTSPNQLTKSSESGDHGLTSPPGKELGSIQHPIYRYLPSSALGPFFWFIHLRR